MRRRYSAIPVLAGRPLPAESFSISFHGAELVSSFRAFGRHTVLEKCLACFFAQASIVEGIRWLASDLMSCAAM